MDKYYVTTPIYYVNDVPHVGHAYTTLAADVLARYHRGKKVKVFFLTGTDEHGQKVAQAAREKGLSPKEYADLVAPRFKEAWRLLKIQYDYFIRTTDPRHEAIVVNILERAKKNGYIKPGVYKGLYCIGCEKFLTEGDLVKNRCPLHPNKEPVYQEEKNWFLKLKKLVADEILPRVESGEYKINPPNRRHEILGRLVLGVNDISISRAGVSWGIPLPWDKSQTVYVWVDALINYYSATQFVRGKKKFWPADLHLIGKDILWFHTVVWQALLLAAGIKKLPKEIYAHGYFTINGQKMSKSLGNVITPKELVERYSVDGARYLLLTAYPFGTDGDISIKRFDEKYNADLANGLGNLVARIERLAENSGFDGTKVGEIENNSEVEVISGTAIKLHDFTRALDYIWKCITTLNNWLDRERPWEKDPEIVNSKLGEIIKGTTAITSIIQIARALTPFLPKTAREIEHRFTQKKIVLGKPLFQRIK